MRRAQLLLLFVACAFADSAAAEYPDHPIRMIVPQAAGSSTDTVTRVLAAALSDELHQQVVVDDRPGGALTLGLDFTSKSPPDGYTLCMGPIGALAITRHLVVPLPYDVQRDFQPIALVARGQLLLAVSPVSSFHCVPELIAYAKANPGKLLNASSSNGSPGHVGGELFKFMTGTDIVHVPYKRRRAGDQRPDGRARAGDVRKPQFDRVVRALRRSARPCRQRRSPLDRIPGSADRGRSRRSGLFGADLVGRNRARGRTAADRRSA